MRGTRLLARLAFATFLAIALGCGAKNGEENPVSDEDGRFTIRLREPDAGDAFEVTANQTTTGAFYNDAKKQTDRQTLTTRMEFTETVLEKPADSLLPTKLTRHYTLAELVKDDAKPEVQNYQGQTVVIQRNAGIGRPRYSYKTEAGKAVLLMDAFRFENERSFRIQDVVPGTPVRVGEEWTVNPEGMLKLLGHLGISDPNPSASSVTGKLTQVFDRDGQQWGDLEISMRAADSQGNGIGKIVVEAPIDGSSIARTQKLTWSATLVKWEGVTTLATTEIRKPLKSSGRSGR